MPTHKKIKVEVELQVPEGRETLSPFQWLYAGAHVRIISMQTKEITDVKIASKVDEKQRQMNEYKRIIQSAIDQSDFKNLKMRGYKSWRQGQIDIGRPSNWGNQLYPIISLQTDQTTLTHTCWEHTSGKVPTKVETKFELGRPTVLSDLVAHINKVVGEFKSKSGTDVQW